MAGGVLEVGIILFLGKIVLTCLLFCGKDGTSEINTWGNPGNRGNQGTPRVIELLIPEADWGLPVTRVTRVTAVTSCLFYRKNAFNNI